MVNYTHLRKNMNRNGLKRLLLLTLPVVLLPVVVYVAAEGQMKSSGWVLYGLVAALLECIVLFLYRLAVAIRDKLRR